MFCADGDQHSQHREQHWQPLEIYKLGQLGDAEGLLKLNVMDCFSCKCCEYICSSKIPLVSKINAAKGLVMPLLKKK